MIEPPPRGEPYPGRIPPVPEQWRRLPLGLRAVLVAPPVVVIVALLAANLAAGIGVGVMLVGAAAATVMYVKNRSDRHNAAVDRGEIAVVADPHLRRGAAGELGPELLARLAHLGYPASEIARVERFDGGWLVKKRSRVELAVVIGDDGGHAFFDRRLVTDLRAASEYLAGRGREPG